MLVTGESKAERWSVLRGALGRHRFWGEEDFLQAGSPSWRLTGEGKANSQVVEMEAQGINSPEWKHPLLVLDYSNMK